MKIGYARTSTLRQVYGLDEQIKKLQNYGCEKIYAEQKSSIYHRPVFNNVLQNLRAGDELVVCSLDRLARNMQHFEKILETITQQKVKLKVLNLGFDFEGATGKLMLQLMMSFAEFERTNMLERQRAGIEKAKENGLIGRHFSPNKEKKIEEALKNYNPETTSVVNLAKTLGISAPTLYKRIRNKFPHMKTQRMRRQQIINEKFNGDETAYKMFRILTRLSEQQQKKIKEVLS